MEPQNTEENKSNRKYIIIIIFLLLVCCVLGELLWLEKQNVKQEIVEKTVYIEKTSSLQNELTELKHSYESLETDDKDIRLKLDEKIKQIDEMQKEAAKHKDDAYIIAKLKRETETLRKIMKGFVVTIDSLNTLNQTLIVEKEKIFHDLSSEKKRTSQLNKDKEDLKGVIELAAVLKASAFKVTGVRYKSGGKKEMETTKAKKSEKIRISFTIGENKVAKPGERELYLRVLTPDGKELESQDENSTFTFGDSKGAYAAKQNITYGNQEYMVTMYCSNKEGFVPGQYITEVYSDGLQIGKGTFNLEK